MHSIPGACFSSSAEPCLLRESRSAEEDRERVDEVLFSCADRAVPSCGPLWKTVGGGRRSAALSRSPRDGRRAPSVLRCNSTRRVSLALNGVSVARSCSRIVMSHNC